MVRLFYVDDCLIFSTSKDKIDELYASLQAYFKIKYDVESKKYLGIELDLRPYGPIHKRQPCLTQGILNIVPGMDKSSAYPNDMIKHPLGKNEEYKVRKMALITEQ